MGLGDLLNALGQGQQGGQGGQPGGQPASPFADWTKPTGSGLASGQAPQLPMHNSGLLQNLLADPSGMGGGNLMQGNGLQAILMRLGVFH